MKRTTNSGQTQFYHRNVTLMLLCGTPPERPAVRLLLDLEPQRPGEAELAPALRLLERVSTAYPRAFDGKDAVVVLNDERCDAYQDAAGLWAQQAAQPGSYASRSCRWWDSPDLLSWPDVHGAIRVVRSDESGR